MFTMSFEKNTEQQQYSNLNAFFSFLDFKSSVFMTRDGSGQISTLIFSSVQCLG